MRAILEPDFKGFEWDDAKALVNVMKHGITFEEAAKALTHPHIESESIRNGEARILAICPDSRRVIVVVYTMRRDICRIISARAARKNEQRTYRQTFSQ